VFYYAIPNTAKHFLTYFCQSWLLDTRLCEKHRFSVRNKFKSKHPNFNDTTWKGHTQQLQIKGCNDGSREGTMTNSWWCYTKQDIYNTYGTQIHIYKQNNKTMDKWRDPTEVS